MILFRADGNSEIGTGHVMRCLSIADAFKRNGEDSVFVLADNSMKRIIEERGYTVSVLNTDFRNMSEDQEQTIALISKTNACILFVDSYYVNTEYLSELKKKVKLVYIDDLAAFAYPVDVLINYNIYADSLDYKALYEFHNEKLPKLLLGTDYVPLRSMFCSVPPKKINETVKDVLISTGGADPVHLAVDLIKAIISDDKMNGITFHFLIGAMNPDKHEIKKLADKIENIVLHSNVSDMKSLICSCDIAVSAAGSTLYEICACGVPLITYVLADNQIEGANAFERKGLAVNCGDIRSETFSASLLFDEIRNLSQNLELRLAIHNNMTLFFNGEGSNRIVEFTL